jgi:hypothetical protein
MREKLLLCAIRTTGAVVALALFVLAARWLELDYDDAKVALSLFSAYFPEFVAIGIAAGVAMVFYRASVSKSDFNFVYFFVSKPEVHEDIWKFGYFVLLVTMVWVVFTMVWRDKLTEGILGVILTAFILKNIADVGGKIWGKPRPPEEPPAPPAKEQ